MSLRPDLKVDWCTHDAAKYAVEHWHYSRRMPSSFAKLNKLGVWENGKFIGSLVFSLGSNRNIGAPYRLGCGEICELVRVALTKHKTPTSRIVAIGVRMIYAEYETMRLIVSYAASCEGHIGTLYQAGNWLYIGGVKGGASYCVNGRLMLNRAVDCSGIDKSTLQKVPGTMRYKYIYPLDAEMRAQVEPLRRPYPKRAESIASDASADQAEEGGATPTPALSH